MNENDIYTPTDADWAEYMEWAESLPVVEPEPETDAEWTAHVANYMAANNLTEMPF
jgi:hypothetical protein